MRPCIFNMTVKYVDTDVGTHTSLPRVLWVPGCYHRKLSKGEDYAT